MRVDGYLAESVADGGSLMDDLIAKDGPAGSGMRKKRRGKADKDKASVWEAYKPTNSINRNSHSGVGVDYDGGAGSGSSGSGSSGAGEGRLGGTVTSAIGPETGAELELLATFVHRPQLRSQVKAAVARIISSNEIDSDTDTDTDNTDGNTDTDFNNDFNTDGNTDGNTDTDFNNDFNNDFNTDGNTDGNGNGNKATTDTPNAFNPNPNPNPSASASAWQGIGHAEVWSALLIEESKLLASPGLSDGGEVGDNEALYIWLLDHLPQVSASAGLGPRGMSIISYLLNDEQGGAKARLDGRTAIQAEFGLSAASQVLQESRAKFRQLETLRAVFPSYSLDSSVSTSLSSSSSTVGNANTGDIREREYEGLLGAGAEAVAGLEIENGVEYNEYNIQLEGCEDKVNEISKGNININRNNNNNNKNEAGQKKAQMAETALLDLSRQRSRMMDLFESEKRRQQQEDIGIGGTDNSFAELAAIGRQRNKEEGDKLIREKEELEELHTKALKSEIQLREEREMGELLALRDTHGSLPDEQPNDGEYDYGRGADTAVSASVSASLKKQEMLNEGGEGDSKKEKEKERDFAFDFNFTEEDTDHVLREGEVSVEEEGLARITKAASQLPKDNNGNGKNNGKDRDKNGKKRVEGHTFGLDDLYDQPQQGWKRGGGYREKK